MRVLLNGFGHSRILCLAEVVVLLLAAGVVSRLIAIPLIINFCVAFLTASRDVLFNIISDADALVSDAAFLFLLASLIVLSSDRRILGGRHFEETPPRAAETGGDLRRDNVRHDSASVIGECVVSTGRRFFANVVTRNCRDDGYHLLGSSDGTCPLQTNVSPLADFR
jgi:hypothetical protein